MFDVDKYFQGFIKTDKIFMNRDVLRPEFIPSQLPHRDLQIQKIAEIIACTLKNSMPSNIFIFGKTGTGKTAVVNHVSERLCAQCRQMGLSQPTWIFFNCKQINTPYRILAKICTELDPTEQIPIAGWPLDVIFDKVIEKLDHFVQTICFLVLDEIDILAKYSQKSMDIFYNLARINTRLHHARVSIIGISNVLNFKSMLDPRVLSSLGEEELVFPVYNALEIRDILEQRAELAFQKGVLDPEVIPLCAAIAAKEHGDARKALDLFRKAGQLAERRGVSHVTTDYVQFAQNDIENDKMKEFCEALPIQSKLVLLSLYQLQRYKGDSEIITGDIYSTYSEMVDFVPGINKLTQRRVSELIRELDLAGIVNARTQSTGRYGRTKFIKLNIPVDEAGRYLMTESRLQECLQYKNPNIQRDTVYFQGHAYKRLI